LPKNNLGDKKTDCLAIFTNPSNFGFVLVENPIGSNFEHFFVCEDELQSKIESRKTEWTLNSGVMIGALQVQFNHAIARPRDSLKKVTPGKS
jgi:hypothetical protein